MVDVTHFEGDLDFTPVKKEMKYPRLNAFVNKGTPIITAGAIAAGCAYVGLTDPESGGTFPKCGFYTITGYYCPGCGMTRALHNVLHLNIFRALQFNALIVLAIPIFAYFYTYWILAVYTDKKLPTFVVKKPYMYTLIALIALFVIGRNFSYPVAEFFAKDRV